MVQFAFNNEADGVITCPKYAARDVGEAMALGGEYWLVEAKIWLRSGGVVVYLKRTARREV